MSKQAEQRLQDALDRLLAGNPERVKKQDRITLNRINNEAGFGRSYIHKFRSFIDDVAEPAIQQYNESLEALSTDSYSTLPVSMTPTPEEKLRAECDREKRLKDKYRNDKKELETKVKQLEAINNTLMFRLYQLQDENNSTVVDIKGVTKS